ncbi:PREDICTED: class II histocompatibility antigen, B-L beta chain-like [Tinamus guttatus]|uniref:class II histocompatibility antigen, B-L beta chain-like n=1 Tax=Tinamus guttatus TaxID=94827 RepID=UPI00052ED9DF|nr:PREDICTED: class II histocompatibility antigen, B-L beta chain-like [Tinamus guttatus]
MASPSTSSESRSRTGETKRVVATDVMQNGDWTYQVLVILETTPQSGDTYTCHVEHVSLQHPLTQDWGAQSDTGRSKMLTGVCGLVLGLIFLAVGLFLYLRNKKGEWPGQGTTRRSAACRYRPAPQP